MSCYAESQQEGRAYYKHTSQEIKYITISDNLNPDNRKYFNIPRIKFTVTLPYGRSIAMQRVQFPLRLAYAMTYNKSQGQEYSQGTVYSWTSICSTQPNQNRIEYSDFL